MTTPLGHTHRALEAGRKALALGFCQPGKRQGLKVPLACHHNSHSLLPSKATQEEKPHLSSLAYYGLRELNQNPFHLPSELQLETGQTSHTSLAPPAGNIPVDAPQASSVPY